MSLMHVHQVFPFGIYDIDTSAGDTRVCAVSWQVESCVLVCGLFRILIVVRVDRAVAVVNHDM